MNDPVTELQERLQRSGLDLPLYEYALLVEGWRCTVRTDIGNAI